MSSWDGSDERNSLQTHQTLKHAIFVFFVFFLSYFSYFFKLWNPTYWTVEGCNFSCFYKMPTCVTYDVARTRWMLAECRSSITREEFGLHFKTFHFLDQLGNKLMQIRFDFHSERLNTRFRRRGVWHSPRLRRFLEARLRHPIVTKEFYFTGNCVHTSTTNS